MRSRVRILAVSHVLPSPDHHHQTSIRSPPPDHIDVDGRHVIKLSFMDAMFVDRVPMQRLFFYEGPDVPPFKSLVRSLKSSLAAVLPAFRPLAGKLTHNASTGDVFVDCSPAAVSSPGVKFVEAEFAGTIDDMRRLAEGHEHRTDAEALALLGPPEPNAAARLPAPVLAVQVTRPVGGVVGAANAVVVAVSVHHAVADGHSVWQFMAAWSAASRAATSYSYLTPPPPPSPKTMMTWDRAAIPYANAEAVAREFLRTVAPALPLARSPPSLYTPPDQRRRTFVLRAGDVKALKQSILAQSKAIGRKHMGGAFPISTYVAVSALVWTSIVRAKYLAADDNDHSGGGGGDAYYLVPVDLRRRLGSPAAVDESYFGNCVAPCYARASVRDLLRDGSTGLARAAAAIAGAVRAKLEDPLGGAERWVEEFLAVPKGRLTHTGSSNRFMAYETDFGWGKPSRVELVSLFTRELVLMLGAAEDGGVQVTVAMDRAHMQGFEASFFAALQVSRRGDDGAKNWE